MERLDNGLAAADGIDLMFQSGNATGDPPILKITPDAAKGTLACDNTAVTCAATVLGTFRQRRTTTGGYMVELAIPRERINVYADRILFNAVLHDAAGDDTFTGAGRRQLRQMAARRTEAAGRARHEPGTGSRPTTTTAAVPDGNGDEEVNPGNNR